jgi:hypothetical protein
MDVNDNACLLVKRVALGFIASKLAPTKNGRALVSSRYRCVAIQINNPA